MRTLPFLWMTACASGPGLSGTWEGTCDIEGSVAEHYDLVYVLTDDKGEVTGSAEVQPDWMMEPVGGTVVGSVEDDRVTLTATLGDDAVNFFLELDGEVDSDKMTGDCASESATGTGELKRTSSGTEE